MKSIARRGLPKKYRDLDQKVYDWLIEEKKNNKCPTKSSIQEFALISYQTAGHSQFKASDGWYRCWRSRWLKGKRISDIQLDTIPEDVNSTSVKSRNVNNSVEDKDISYDIFETLNSLKQLNNLASGIDVNENVECKCSGCKGKAINSKTCIYKANITKRCNRQVNPRKNRLLRSREIEKGLRKRLIYLPNFREEVLLYAKSHSIKECSLKYNLNEETIRNWKRSKEYTNPKVNVPTWDTNFQLAINDCTVNENSFISWLKECKNITKNSIGEKLKEAIDTASSTSEWFSAYARRYLRTLEATKEKHTFHSKIHYPEKFRQAVVRYSKLTSQRKASVLFNISRKSIYSWMKPSSTDEIIDCDKEKTKSAIEREVFNWYDSKNPKPKPKQIKDKGRRLFEEEYKRKLKCSYMWYYRWCRKYSVPVRNTLDDVVLEWLLVKMDENETLSHKIISEKATEIYKANDVIDFNVSTSWVLRFCRRHMRLLRCIPSLSDKLPKSLENKIKEFRNDLTKTLSDSEFCYELFGVMDELPLKFVYQGECPKQKPLIRQCGFSGINCTVVLCCDVTGELFPPFIILKGEEEEEIASLFVQFQKDGKMDENMMKHWINEIWFRFKTKNSLLLLDTYKEHTKEWVEKTFEERSSKLVIVPGGCSSKLMPLTQVVSKKFEDLVEEEWRKWTKNNRVLSTEQLPPPDSVDIVKWIQIAYETICDTNVKDVINEMFEEMKLISEE